MFVIITITTNDNITIDNPSAFDKSMMIYKMFKMTMNRKICFRAHSNHNKLGLRKIYC